MRKIQPWMFDGLQYWFDAQAKETLFQDSTFTTPVSLDGDPVGGWRDRSVNAYDLAQSLGTKQPLYRTNGINGKPALIADGVDDIILRATPILAQPLSIYAVIQLLTITSSRSIVTNGSISSADRLRLSTSGSGNFFFLNGGSTVLSSAVADLLPHIHTMVFAMANSAMFLDGAQRGTGDVGSNVQGGLSLFGNTGGGTYNAAIGEVLVYSEVHSVHQRSSMERYLMRKWGFL